SNIIFLTEEDGILYRNVTVVQTCALPIFQPNQWTEYLFRDGSMIGLNKDILSQYVEYITNIRMEAVGLKPAFDRIKNNPIPWIKDRKSVVKGKMRGRGVWWRGKRVGREIG